MTTEHEMDADAKTVADMGYSQELHRGMSALSNFAISFSIISILAGCITSYKIALVSGGPSALTLGWLIVGAGIKGPDPSGLAEGRPGLVGPALALVVTLAVFQLVLRPGVAF